MQSSPLVRLAPWIVLIGSLSARPVPCQSNEGEDRVEQVLARLTLEQRAGQLLTSFIFARADGDVRASLLGHVRELGLGGVILSLGSTAQAADLVDELQAAALESRSGLPLMVAGDFEQGLAFRLYDATDLGPAMLLGATGSRRLARDAGTVTAREGRALGFRWNFAPVLDVSINPRNPIINVRSFGEDPGRVAALGQSFVDGLQAGGMLACGKHFPGHGDVETDSHLALATVPGNRARLDRVELRPFRAVVRTGIASIMTGHLAVPGLGEKPGVPATLSPRILTGLLREQLQFDGLVVTDALDMGGVKNAFPPEEVAVRALSAGADVLLMPPDPAAVRAAVVAAVQSGRLPKERLDDAVRRILRAKRRVGLISRSEGDGAVHYGSARNWREVVGSDEHEELACRIARRGVTLVRDDGGALPMRAGPKTVLVQVSDGRARPDPRGLVEGQFFAERLEARLGGVERVRVVAGDRPDRIAAAARAVVDADRLLVGLYARVRSSAGRVDLPEDLDPVLAALRTRSDAVVVSFGNPYLIEQMPQVGCYVTAYGAGRAIERAVADGLVGDAGFAGRLPVGVPGVCRAGDGLSTLPALAAHGGGALLEHARPETEDLAADLESRVRAVLERGVAARVFPGAVAWVARRGVVAAEVAVGRHSEDESSASVTVETPYDLADLTSVCATVPTVLHLVAAGSLTLDDPVQQWLPGFSGAGKGGVTVRHLLSHTSGLPASVPFHRSCNSREEILAAALREELEAPPGARAEASDVGLIVLGELVSRVAGGSFASVCRARVFAPLGMEAARFVMSDDLPWRAAPPTERATDRGHGRVRDADAFAMGGAAGHAGLFATAADVGRVALLFSGAGRGLLPAQLARAATHASYDVAGEARGFGFEVYDDGTAFGLTGKTGTSVWCDRRHDLVVVLLTNRAHPTRVHAPFDAVRNELQAVVLDALR